MRFCIFLVSLFFTAMFAAASGLQEVASFPNEQVTGVAVSKSGRVFANFPNWSDDHTLSVVEIINGKAKPYPSKTWNKPGPASTHFICVQSVYVDGEDTLWILDPAAPKMQEIVKDGPKLVKVDLKTNKSVRIIPFEEDIAPKKSYLNDVRVDTNAAVAFITDSGLGAIVVVNLKNGKARRLLQDHASTRAEPDVKLVVDGRELIDQQKKTVPQINSDGIALDLKNDYLYYHALTAHTLYRIKTQYLKDESLSKRDLESKIENMGATPAPDGMLESPDGSVYLTAIEQNAIVHFDPATKKIRLVAKDKRLSWPDTMSWGPDGVIFVTASQIQNMPRFNGGDSARTEPYKVWKVSPVTK